MQRNLASPFFLLLGALCSSRMRRALLATGGVLAGLLSASTVARAQLASETVLYSFSQRLGFYGGMQDYPPLVQAPGVSNDGLAIYGLLPVTGDGAGGSGVFVFTSGTGKVGTIYSDGNSDIYNVFLGVGGSAAYAVSPESGLISLPGGGVVNSTYLKPIIQGTDKTFYGFAGSEFSRITAGGVAPITSVDITPVQLIQASDGNFYVIGVSGIDQILASNSTVTKLVTLEGQASDAAQLIEATGSGADRFYGFSGDMIFALNRNAGGTSTLTVLHTLDSDTEGSPLDSMVLGTDGNLYGTARGGGPNGSGTFIRVTPTGVCTVLYAFGENAGGPESIAQLSDGNFYVVFDYGGTSGGETIAKLQLHLPFFAGEAALDDGVYYLSFPDKNYFGYYAYLTDPNYIYHFDLGYEYLFDAKDGKGGMYLYDFKSKGFFYTSLEFPFPYLYDFTLKTFLYYYPDPKNPGHYNTNGVRYFYDFATKKIISK